MYIESFVNIFLKAFLNDGTTATTKPGSDEKIACNSFWVSFT